MTTAFVYLPKAVGTEVLAAVQERACDAHGGFTTVGGSGGWKNADGEVVKEDVWVVSVAGAGRTWAESTAEWVQERTDESAVMWRVSNGTHGFA